MGIFKLVNKKFLLKGSLLFIGFVGVVSGSSEFSNLRFLMYDLNEIPSINFKEDKKLHKLFKDGRCTYKFLPGKIKNNLNGEISEKWKKNIYLSTNGFSGVSKEQGGRENVGFNGTAGCIDARIKYNDVNNRGIIGNIEFVIWNNPTFYNTGNVEYNGYAMVMRSIIYGTSKEFNFLNQITTLQKNKNMWTTQNSIVWFDSVSVSQGNKKIKLLDGNKEIFNFDLKISDSSIVPDKFEKYYEKLALWNQREKNKGQEKLLGNLSIYINDKNTDLWTDMNNILQENDGKNQDFDAKLFYTGGKWYSVDKFPYYHKFFHEFDTYNEGWNNNNTRNHLSIYGKWTNIEW